MNQSDRETVEEAVNAMSRLALFVVDELEPLNQGSCERDLEAVYEVLVAAERKLIRWIAQHSK